MIEDREELPQRSCGKDPGDFRARDVVVPEPRCGTHSKGRCACEDDGLAARERYPEDDLR